jgi:pimeloyl-ACP methyl ester carboxylesterase
MAPLPHPAATPPYVTRWGESGPPIVMVHGGVQGGAVGGDTQFLAQKPLSESGWQLLLPDRPGHGRSPYPGRPDDASEDGAWVAELLGDGAHLVGHSFGGCVALDAAARRIGAVRSLTLIEPGMQRVASDVPAVRKFGLRMILAFLFSLSAESRARKVMRILNIPAPLLARYSPEELARMGRSITRAKFPSEETLRQQLAQVRQAKLPLLVVSGGWSPAFEATADAVAALGGGTRIVINSGDHFPHLRAGDFNPALSDFMSRAM